MKNDQRRCGISHADAASRAQQCIPDENDQDLFPEFHGLSDEQIDKACGHWAWLTQRGAFKNGNTFATLVMTARQTVKFRRLVESNDMTDDEKLGRLVREVMK